LAHKLRFHRDIPEDLEQAIRYYQAVSVELANRFRIKVNRRLDEIAERPESFAVDMAPVRFAKVHRFPYIIPTYSPTRPSKSLLGLGLLAAGGRA